MYRRQDYMGALLGFKSLECWKEIGINVWLPNSRVVGVGATLRSSPRHRGLDYGTMKLCMHCCLVGRPQIEIATLFGNSTWCWSWVRIFAPAYSRYTEWMPGFQLVAAAPRSSTWARGQYNNIIEDYLPKSPKDIREIRTQVWLFMQWVFIPRRGNQTF